MIIKDNRKLRIIEIAAEFIQRRKQNSMPDCYKLEPRMIGHCAQCQGFSTEELEAICKIVNA